MTREAITTILKSAGSQWSDRNAPRLGASLAYYTLLSLAPLLILMVAICGSVFTKTEAEKEILDRVQELAGYSSANTVKTLIDNAHQHGSGVLATVIALVTLFFGASGVFLELRDSLNTIWDAPKSTRFTWRRLLWQRMVSLGMVLGLGFLLTVSLIVSTAISMVQKFFAGFVPIHFALIGEITNFFISLIAMAILFALIFKLVPDVPIAWRDVGIGAICTSVLFTIGKALLGIYLGRVGVGSTYGAAGSLVALVVWVYYSAQIFFFGAIFTKVYADTVGSHSGRNPGLGPAERQPFLTRRAAGR